MATVEQVLENTRREFAVEVARLNEEIAGLSAKYTAVVMQLDGANMRRSKQLNTKDADRHKPDPWSGDKGSEGYADFAFRMESWVRMLDASIDGDLLEKAAKEPEYIDDIWVQLVDEANVEKMREISRLLGFALLSVTRGQAALTVTKAMKAVKGNGFRVWQELARWHRPKNNLEVGESMRRSTYVEQAKSVTAPHKAIDEFELRVTDHEARFGEKIPESLKIASVTNMMTSELQDQLAMEQVMSCAELRSSLANYISINSSMAQSMNNRGGASQKRVPMEIGNTEPAESPSIEEIYAIAYGKGKAKGKGKQWDQSGNWDTKGLSKGGWNRASKSAEKGGAKGKGKAKPMAKERGPDESSCATIAVAAGTPCTLR
eukprot:NODE_24_length_2804_cov_184.412150.p1 GENE.NODE_24_length_2804_cov_184.412150~~NODE_24_length_2804_cov_184.412150.p1  ORF type:complete len:375 (-),score=84.54 NODE_24_length_2804_cov_184.412150:1365-2489(-)